MLTLQRLAGNAAVTRLVAAHQRDNVQAALRAAGRPLSEPVRADMEARLGANLASVRVHTGPAADRAARSVSAEAFTTGSHLVFRQGRYNPRSGTGRRVLAHELAHVLQQRRGPVTGTGSLLKVSNPGDRFERAAETTARRVMGRPTAPAGLRPASGHVHAQDGGALPAQALAVQRAYTGKHYVNYDPVTYGSGSKMTAELHPNDPSLTTGSSPSVKPPWWSKIGAAAAWFKRYMVQGHLLNEKLGGPGWTMENLTPITKGANSQHHARVESTVKKEVLTNKNVVEYVVMAHYNKYPVAADMAASASVTPAVISDINKFVKKMAWKISAQYTVYDPKTKANLGEDRWVIYNDSL